MKKILLAVAALCLSYPAHAQDMMDSESQSLDETIVFGEANNPDGTKTDYILEQGADEVNPLGEPIMAEPEQKKVNVLKDHLGKTLAPAEPEVVELQPMESNAWEPVIDEIPADRPNGSPQGTFLPVRTYPAPVGENIVEPKTY